MLHWIGKLSTYRYEWLASSRIFFCFGKDALPLAMLPKLCNALYMRLSNYPHNHGLPEACFCFSSRGRTAVHRLAQHCFPFYLHDVLRKCILCPWRNGWLAAQNLLVVQGSLHILNVLP